ncbi:hypothetical protein [Luteimonas sp. TWI1437]|uniref:hypothetical protein n=1 Tax=unclassified Luteimonas TaxID=2629088 RepID=UPI00320A9948
MTLDAGNPEAMRVSPAPPKLSQSGYIIPDRKNVKPCVAGMSGAAASNAIRRRAGRRPVNARWAGTRPSPRAVSQKNILIRMVFIRP